MEALADFLTVHSVNVVICGNIGSGAKNALREKRIELILVLLEQQMI